MKYEYMKEYPCNGEKPDLPDDVSIEFKLEETTVSWLKSTIGGTDWRPNIYGVPEIEKFRIVDERYKPKSDWLERGELPPIKTTHNDCELVGLGYSKPKFEVAAHHYNGVTAIVSVKTEYGVRLHNAKACHFRPLRTERDELIGKAVDIAIKADEEENGDLAIDAAGMKPIVSALYGAGMLKKPEEE